MCATLYALCVTSPLFGRYLSLTLRDAVSGVESGAFFCAFVGLMINYVAKLFR